VLSVENVKMINEVFVYIWEYIVKEEYLTEFNSAYGPYGDWVKLFKKADGYIATDLHQDTSNLKRFVTIDFWKTKNDKDNFLNQFYKEYKLLDEKCEKFTTSEKLLGNYNSFVSRFKSLNKSD
jgi:heme-degrading monooxygenase HmoA